MPWGIDLGWLWDLNRWQRITTLDNTIRALDDANEEYLQALEKDEGQAAVYTELLDRSSEALHRFSSAAYRAGERFPDCENVRKAYVDELFDLGTQLEKALGLGTNPKAGYALDQEEGGNT